jgi:hypothetical protein
MSRQSRIRITELEFDEDNEAEMARHNIYPIDVLQLLDHPFTVVRNRRDRSGEWLLIGRTAGGRVLTVPLAPTSSEGRWRPITGWDSKRAERARLPR